MTAALVTSDEVACSCEVMPSDEVADEVASEAMPSDEVASEVITSDAEGNGAMMTSVESMISADVTFDATVCIAMATDAAVDSDMVTSKEADNGAMTSTEAGYKVAMLTHTSWDRWLYGPSFVFVSSTMVLSGKDRNVHGGHLRCSESRMIPSWTE